MKETMDKIEKLLIAHGRGKFRPATEKDLSRAQEFGFPDELIEFYRLYEPSPGYGCIELEQSIWSIDSAILENTDAVPGCTLYPHGYVVFASNSFGDAYCMDVNVYSKDNLHPIVLFPHETINEDTTLTEFYPYRLEVADSLKDFLKKFADQTLITEPFYG